MRTRSPWRLARLHIPTGSFDTRLVKFGERQLAGITIHTRQDFLEMISACNAQQPGTWQYWESSQ